MTFRASKESQRFSQLIHSLFCFSFKISIFLLWFLFGTGLGRRKIVINYITTWVFERPRYRCLGYSASIYYSPLKIRATSTAGKKATSFVFPSPLSLRKRLSEMSILSWRHCCGETIDIEKKTVKIINCTI